MARAKDYRYKITDADEKLPKKGLVKVEDGVAVYDRLLKTRELAKYKLIDLNTQVKKIPGVKSVNIILTFEPPWDRSMMSEEALLELNML